MVGVAELDLFEVLRAEGLLLHRFGRVGRNIDLLIGQREGGLTDDEMVAGGERAMFYLAAKRKQRIPSFRQSCHFQPITVAKQSDMPA